MPCACRMSSADTPLYLLRLASALARTCRIFSLSPSSCSGTKQAVSSQPLELGCGVRGRALTSRIVALLCRTLMPCSGERTRARGQHAATRLDAFPHSAAAPGARG